MSENDVLAYSSFISPDLLKKLEELAEAVPGIPGLKIRKVSSKDSILIEDQKALQFICTLYDEVKDELALLLKNRMKDRRFIDSQTKVLVKKNAERDLSYLDPLYETILGKKDSQSNIVVGPARQSKCERPLVAELPPHLKGFHITLFGPSDNPKMSINAMNAWHRIADNENEIVTKLVNESGIVPMWGADDEDSKTPDIETFASACKNLMGCFKKDLSYEDKKTAKKYILKDWNLSRPIKRPPGLALPSGGHIYKGRPLPLHIFDFGMHLFHCWENPEALTFYFPKLENEGEARYLKNLIMVAEKIIKKYHPSYELGTVRILVVFENPRAIFRMNEMMEELYPYFAGGSLGWHDYLASTARLFKLDPNYRIPIKADPDIVIKHIKTSHHLVAKEVGEKGGIAIGGMYGVLPEAGNIQSYNLAMIGFIKDVLIQLKRGLHGFWVAHPDFVRLGIALTWAWKKYNQNAQNDNLKTLIEVLLPESPLEQGDIWDFILKENDDVFEKDDPLYNRSLLAGNIQNSSICKNNDPEEIRYNIYQSLQYFVDWLGGNGCVALPATLRDREGKEIFVRIMDDLATTERSRWEVWAEIFHGRFSKESFIHLLLEEIDFIRRNQETETKKIQVRWNDETKKWYLVAMKILIKLMTDPTPCEFATELLLPFTFDCIKSANDPWLKAQEFDPEKFTFSDEILVFEKEWNKKFSS
jgi:malate synthase